MKEQRGYARREEQPVATTTTVKIKHCLIIPHIRTDCCG